MLSGFSPPALVTAQESAHPKTEFIVRAVRPSHRVSLAESETVSGAFRELRAILLDAATKRYLTTTVGTLDGNFPYVLGYLAGGAIYSDGSMLALDSRYNEMRLFDPKGRYVTTVGRPGSGPGEFVEPRKLLLEGREKVFVMDSHRRLHLFTRTGQNYLLQRSVTLPLQAEDVCLLDSNLVVHSRSRATDSLVYLLARNEPSEPTLSFGRVYASPNRRVNVEIGRGRIACDASTKVIVYSPSVGIPELRGYSPSGTLKWITIIDGLRSPEITEPRGGTSYRVQVPPRGYHRLHSLVTLRPGFVVAQYAFVSREAWKQHVDFELLHTFVIATRTGEAISLGTRVPPIIAATARYLLVARNDPFPILELHATSRP